MKFTLDENLPGQVSDLFRSAGYDVANIFEEGLSGHSDAAIAQACAAGGRCFVTMDADFANVRVNMPQEFPGMIVIRLQSLGRRGVLRIVPRLLTALKSHHIQGQLWIVERNGIRVRTGSPTHP